MFCPECGKKNEGEINFCENCGTKLSQEVVSTVGKLEENLKEELKWEDEMPLSPKKKGRVGTYLKVYGVEGLILILAILAFHFVFQKSFGIEETVERYYEAREEGDWNQVYSLLYTKEWKSELLDQASFVTAKAINQETGEKKSLERVRVVDKSLQTAKVRVTLVKEEEGEQEEELRLTLVRKGLAWKIKDESDILGPIEIQVPEKSKIRLDKVEVSKSYKAKNKKEMDIYEIPKLFGKKHYLEVSGKGMKTVTLVRDFTKETEVKDGKEKSVTKVGKSFDDKTLQKVSNQGIQDYQSIMEGASTNKGISDVPALNTMYGEKKESNIKAYEKFRNEDFYFDAKYYEQSFLKLTNSEVKASNQEHNGEKMIRLEVSSDFYQQYFDVFFSEPEEKENKGKIETVLWYIKDGKEWKLYEVELPNL